MATQKKSAKKSEETAPKAKAPAAAKSAVTTAAPSTAQVDPRNAVQRRKVVVGTVMSDKMQKTIVVKVDRRVRHAAYKKYIVRSRRFKAHDEKNEAKIGDRVTILESRPLSRDKRWVLQSILRRAGQTVDVNV